MKKKLFYFITKSNWGGAQRYVYDFAIHAGSEYDVTVVLGAPRTDTIESGKGVLLKKLLDKKVRVIQIDALKRDISLRDETKVLWKIFCILWREKPDVIHLNSSKAAGLTAFAGRLLGVPRIVFTVHGLPAREPRPRLERKAIAILTWLTSFFSHHTITVTRADFEELTRLPLLKNKVSHIPNGLLPQARLSQKDARTIFQGYFKNAGLPVPSKDAVWSGTIGELTANKGHTVALRALEKIPSDINVVHIIIGGGEEEQALRREIHRLGLSSKVLLAGFIPNASTMLSAFDLFILPSYKEGLPYALLEAGFAGIPVIATRTGEVPELLAENRGTLVEPGDESSLASKMIPLLVSDQERTLHAKNFLAYLTKEYSFETMFEKTKILYNK